MGKKSKKSKSRAQPKRKIDTGDMYNTGQDTAILLIDCNNVRGCFPAFAHTLAGFIKLLLKWTQLSGLSGRVFCLVDHGRVSDSYILDNSLMVVFAGSGKTADDLICEDARGYTRAKNILAFSNEGAADVANDNDPVENLPKLLRGNKVAVITNDRGLKKRLTQPSSSQPSLPTCIKVYRSNYLLDMIRRVDPVQLSGAYLPLYLEDHLRPLENAECRLREAFSTSEIKLKSTATITTDTSKQAEEEKENTSLLSTSDLFPFGEVTWQRVVTAEVLRLCLAKMDTKLQEGGSSELSSSSVTCAVSEDGIPALVSKDREQTTFHIKDEIQDQKNPEKTKNHSLIKSSLTLSNTLIDTKLRLFLSISGDIDSCDLVNVEKMNAMLHRNYIVGRSRRYQEAKLPSLLFDHRIRHDKLSCSNLVEFMKTENITLQQKEEEFERDVDLEQEVEGGSGGSSKDSVIDYWLSWNT